MMNPNENQAPQPTSPENPTPDMPPAPAPEEQPATPAPDMTPPAPDSTAPAPVEPAAAADPAATTPNPFGQPAGPIGSAPADTATPAPAPAGGSKKKLIILLSAIGGAVLLLVAAAIAIYFIFFNVTKEDYEKANAQVQVVSDKVSDTSFSSSVTKSTIEDAQAAYEEYKVENAKLAEMKALRVDSELSPKYNAYADKAKEYIKFMDEVLPSMVALVDATDKLSTASESAEMTEAYFQSIIDILKDAQPKVTDSTLKEFLDKSVAAYEAMLPAVKEYENATSSSAQLAALRKVSDLTGDITDASTAMSKELKERAEAVSPKQTFDDLSAAVTKKLNSL